MSSMYSLKSHKQPRASSPPARGDNQARLARQQGLTLIELMVGITIGLLVVIAALGTVSYTQITSTTVGDSSRLQQTADSVFRNIGFQTAQAGAIKLQATDTTSVVFSTNFTGFNPGTTSATPGTGQIYAVHGIDGGATGADTLRVSYEDDGGIRDCQGSTSGTATRVDNQFTLSNGSLMCTGAAINPTAQPIADGVEDFQVLYGVQTIAAGSSQYRFYTADTITDWTNIQAVRICLQLIGELKSNPQPGLTLTGCKGQSVSADGFIRRVYWRTFALRNKLL